ncbi:MAG: DUF1186 domain-containing protein [Burkholderiales bacterium]|nr:DUF1186 domain-containing protein [Burkholderiales bacterium]
MSNTAWQDIEGALRHYDDAFPQAALEQALAQYDAIAPHLVAELEACMTAPDMRCDDESGWMLHLYAMHLLAAKRDERGFAPLLGMAHLPGETLENLLGDHLTEGMPRAMAATCPQGGDAQLMTLAEDRSAYLWSRSAALRALALRALEGDLPRAELLAWLDEAGTREAERMVDDKLQPVPDTDTDYLSELVITLEEIGGNELAAKVAEWFDDGLIDDNFSKPEDAAARLARDWATCRADELAYGWGYPTDILAEIGRWACFHPDEDGDEDEDAGPPQQPFQREEPKVGRNDPCPCGSGKKYKKCCGAA